MESIGIKMIERFCSGTEKDFKDNTLNQIIKEDDATKLYYDETVSTIDEYLKVHDNLNGLKYNYDDREKSYIVRNFKDRVNEPVYGNIWNGLAICIHSLYGNEIEIRDFEKEENGYSYTLHFTMYDVFGLYSDDIEKMREVLRNLSGYGSAGEFRSWYILQHWDKYNGTYKPVVTYIEFDMPVRKMY